ALLLPRRRPGQRAPLWQQRKRAGDLLAVASRYESFPMVLESYRELLQDVFDMPGLPELVASIRSRQLRVEVVGPRAPATVAAPRPRLRKIGSRSSSASVACSMSGSPASAASLRLKTPAAIGTRSVWAFRSGSLPLS